MLSWNAWVPAHTPAGQARPLARKQRSGFTRTTRTRAHVHTRPDIIDTSPPRNMASLAGASQQHSVKWSSYFFCRKSRWADISPTRSGSIALRTMQYPSCAYCRASSANFTEGAAGVGVPCTREFRRRPILTKESPSHKLLSHPAELPSLHLRDA